MEGENETQPLLEPQNVDVKSSRQKCYLPCRYALALLLCGQTLEFMTLRSAFSIGLVAMVNFTDTDPVNQSIDSCPVQLNVNTSSDERNGDFNWDETIQDTLLASFGYGYIVTQIFGGILADKYSAKYTLGISIFCMSALTIVIPFVAHASVKMLIALRVLQGLLTGPVFPAAQAIWGCWAPPQERATLYAISVSGGGIGWVVGDMVAGILCQSSYLGGWPLCFYVIGSSGIVWSFIWFLFVSDKPHKHPRISKEELEYIEASTGAVNKIKFHFPPLKEVFMSAPVWAIAFACLGDGFLFGMSSTIMPLYMKQILHYDISQNGTLSSLAFMCSWVVGLLAGPMADWTQKYISTTATRNIFSIVAECGTSMMFVAIAWAGCNRALSVLFQSIGGVFNGLNVAGFYVSPMDIAPMYAGSLQGFFNCLGQVGGIVSPSLQGFITHGEPSKSKWCIVFYVIAGAGTLGTLLFALLFSAKELPWALAARRRQEEEDSKNADVNTLPDDRCLVIS